MTLEKSGARTGKTTGSLTRTCVGIHVYENGMPLLRFLPCQFQSSDLRTEPGDSGSPVYHVNASGNADPLFGLVWGTEHDNDALEGSWVATFSHVRYVHRELADAMGGGWFDVVPGSCGFCGY